MNTGRERAVVALLLDEGPELSSLRLKRLFDSLVERTRIKIYSGDRLRVINSDRFESQILPLPCKREGGIFVNLWFSLIAPLVLLRAARKEASGFLVFSAWSSLLALPAAFFARKPLIVVLWSLGALGQDSRGFLALVAARVLRLATCIHVPHEIFRQQLLAAGIPADRVVVAHLPALIADLETVTSGEHLAEQRIKVWKDWESERAEHRDEVSELHNFPEAATALFVLERSRSQVAVERIIRAVSSLPDEDVVLFLCVQPQTRSVVDALRVGLGLSMQSRFITSATEALEILSVCDLAIVLGESDKASGPELIECLGLAPVLASTESKLSRELLPACSLLPAAQGGQPSVATVSEFIMTNKPGAAKRALCANARKEAALKLLSREILELSDSVMLTVENV